MKQTDKRRANREKPVKVKPPDYQPSVAEMNEEHDMPGASMKDLRRAFFKPVEGDGTKPVRPSHVLE